MAKRQVSLIPAERIEREIIVMRGEKVMLDTDLAMLYGVTTRMLNQSVTRNRERFPSDFMFQLNEEEAEVLRLQSGSSNKRGGRRYLPFVFTEQGVAMLSSILRSKRAVEVNIAIMRAFVRLRQLVSSHADLARKLDQLEKKYDQQFAIVFDAICQLMEPPTPAELKEMGYHTLIRKSDGQGSTSKRLRVTSPR